MIDDIAPTSPFVFLEHFLMDVNYYHMAFWPYVLILSPCFNSSEFITSIFVCSAYITFPVLRTSNRVKILIWRIILPNVESLF